MTTLKQFRCRVAVLKRLAIAYWKTSDAAMAAPTHVIYTQHIQVLGRIDRKGIEVARSFKLWDKMADAVRARQRA